VVQRVGGAGTAPAALADLVIKPDGANEIDVTRVQMLFFTVVTAVFVAIKIVYSQTIPDIPQAF